MRAAITLGEGECRQHDIREQCNNNNVAACPRITVTKITSYKPQKLTKSYFLDDDGKIQVKTSASMTEGQAEIVELSNLGEFSKLLSDLKPNQALCFGVPKQSPVKLRTKKCFEEMGRPDGYAPRSKEAFSWPNGAGLMLLDYDPRPGRTPLTPEQLREQLIDVVPALAAAGSVQWLSSSSMIYNSETQDQLHGIKGQRIWVSVQDASDIPRAGKALIDRLWLAGHGWYEVSRSSILLERCTVDASVWQTNRLDFAAGASCIAPLEQRRGNPVVVNGQLLNTREAIPDLSEQERAQLATIKTQARALVKDEAEAIKQKFIEEKVLAIAPNIADKDAKQVAFEIARRAVDNRVLMGDYPIILDDGTTVTVGDVLDDPGMYHGKQTRDPLEPEYCNNKVVGKLYLLGSRPNLFSFAHGGQTFRLIRQPRRIEMVRGRTYEAVNRTIAVMREMPDIFDLGEQLVTVGDGRTHAMDEHLCAHWLGGVVQYWHWQKTPKGASYEVLDDPAPKLVKALLSLGRNRNLKALDAVITAPVITPDGDLVNTPGYHVGSRLLLDVTDQLPPVPAIVDVDQVREAVDVLMYPYKDFPFCSEMDKAIFLAALMTAVQRPVLPTAPGFAVDAPVQGSGKTLLAQCAAVLGTGQRPTVWPHTAGRDDEEARKRIFTALRTGERALIWDNVTGIFNSAAVAALLTSESYTDRQLGKSEAYTIPNRALFLMTGNNMSFTGDMPRRVLKCRIDPQTDKPYARSFALDPLHYTTNNRQAMVAAVLTIIRGWFQSFDFITGQTATGRMASFEQWDDMIRQPIAWLNREVMPDCFADVMEAVHEAQGNDPEQEALGDLLRELRGQFGGDPFTTKELMHKIGTKFSSDVLAEAVRDTAGSEVRSTKSLGRILKFRTGRIVDGLVLAEVVKDQHANVRRWVVQTAAQN